MVVPVGNAGNVTAIMEGFLDLYRLSIIPALPQIVAVQSRHANPVASWRASGRYEPMKVQLKRGAGRHDRRSGFISQGEKAR